MLLIKATNDTVQQYPYSVGLLRKENPNTSFPKQVSAEDMAAFNVYPVTEVTPTVSDTQKLVKVWTPTLVGGDWVLAHEAVDLTSDDIAEATAVLAANMREERNKRLAATDWTSSSDVTMSAEMRTYRASLRDVPAQENFPTVTWPTEVTA
tara:strand:+ start:564 stop:1016 length:453 start_codon:yes stop_codon:yes gene_type:complete